MAMPDIEARILEALEGEAPAQGLDIVGVEVSGPAQHPTLRVRIDTLDDAPIDMDQVAARTSWVSGIVEAADPFPGAYELEVSSPGIDRPLRRPRDFAAQVGERAEVTTREAIDGRRSWTGEIVATDDASVTVRVDGEDFSLPFDLVRQAKLKPDFDKIFAAAKKAAKQAGLDEDADAPDDGE